VPLKTAFFDLDGTLIDSIPLIRLSFEYTFDKLGIPWGKGEVLKTIGLPLRDVAAYYAGERAEDFLNIYAQFQQENQEKLLKAYPGAKDTLIYLKKRGYHTGVVTSKRRNPTKTSLSLTELDSYLDVVVTVEDIERPKPDPDGINTALKILATSPAKTVYSGDSIYDIQTGKNAGVATIAVTWGIATEKELKSTQPDFLVKSWEELIQAIEALNKK
jgi:pyrophosphatase PpaX